jgi:hypothetical protein
VITSQLTKLKQTASAIPGSGSDSTKQSKALSGQINEAYAKSLAQKIDQTCPSAGSCSSDKAKLCAGYTSISQGVDPSKLTAPTICK